MLPLDDLIERARNDMRICNACRYCEGYCAVFPAMERRLEFTTADLHYLANLCHNCGECYHACQYAPPHEFAVNVPQSMARVRAASYQHYTWPQPLARLFTQNGVFAALSLALGWAGMLTLAVALNGGPSALVTAVPGGDFYRVVPHGVMAAVFGAVGIFALLALVVGVARFWRDSGETFSSLGAAGPWWQAVRDVVTLRYLHGAGTGCEGPEAALGGSMRSGARRWFHHLTMHGFLLCFAATAAGTVYHYGFGWPAPYGYLSLPVILGTLGGLGLVIGLPGLWWLKRRREPALVDASQHSLDSAFLVLLWLVAASGLALLATRDTAALGLMLVMHLGTVLALFVMLPYGKSVHGLYRAAALLKHAIEQRRPHCGVNGD